MATNLTPIQRRALDYLRNLKRPYAIPSDIGYAIAVNVRRPGGMKAQGAGRLGGMVATQLMRMGLVENASHQRDGFSAYRISKAGREVE